MTDRDFFIERMTTRLQELRRKHPDDATFFVEASKVLLSMARDDRERREAEAMIKLMKTARRLGIYDESP